MRGSIFLAVELLFSMALQVVFDLLRLWLTALRSRRALASPGPVTSSLLARDGAAHEKLQETKDWIQSQIPVKRFGTPEEIAAAVLYLTSSESAFVLGAELIIDGGMATL